VPSNPGLVEVTMPLEYILSWLFNSHIENVRKTINDMFVYDPSRIVESDLTRPGPGRLIRLRPEAHGTPVSNAIQQLRTSDVTSGHLKDMEVVLDLLQRVTAVTDNLLGLPIVGGRRTAAEVRGVRSQAVSRLKTLADLLSALTITPWTRQMAANNRQFLEDSQFVRITGKQPPYNFLEITPEDLIGDYDYPVGDPSLPVDKQDMAETWKDILTLVLKSPQLQQEGLSPLKILKKTVSYLDVYELDEFMSNTVPQMPTGANVSVQPDQQVEDQVKAGNYVPIEPNSGNQQADQMSAILGPLAGGPNGRQQ
jgi:hypothetical protein